MKKGELHINKIPEKYLLKVLLITSLVMMIIISLTGCSPGTKVPYEIINDTLFTNSYYEDNNAKISIINNLDLIPEETIDWIYFKEDKESILAVDYTQYFLVLLFNGYRISTSAPINEQFHLLNVWRNGNKITFHAHFDDVKPGGPTYFSDSSEYLVVKIKRTDLKVTGDIVFSLIDEERKERASTSYVINK